MLESRADTGLLVCAALRVAVVVGGSPWVTRNANANMMPAHMTVDRARVRG